MLKRPLDGGATIRGRRVFGDNKTWRGAIVMFAGTFVAAVVLCRFGWYRNALPDEVADAAPALFGVLVAFGMVAGELPNSFAKRRLGIAPGQQRRSRAGIAISIADQGDIVIGIWICLLPIWVMSVGEAALAFVVFAAAHLASARSAWRSAPGIPALSTCAWSASPLALGVRYEVVALT